MIISNRHQEVILHGSGLSARGAASYLRYPDRAKRLSMGTPSAMQPSDPPLSLQIGAVTLTVRDLARVSRFYREVIGLRDLGGGRDTARLGTGTAVLLELRRDPEAPRASPREPGLFHTAFLLPSRIDLGRWTRFLANERLPIEGAADHHVSEALYLSDPEGNGVEVYADRPRAAWPRSGDAISIGTDPLDIDSVMRAAGEVPWAGAPDGMTVGHIHLRVGSTEPAEAFYGGVLGLPLTARYPGGSFFGADGYHHHIAANTWQTHGAGTRTPRAAGLASVELRSGSTAAFDAVARRAAEAGGPAERRGSTLHLRDPWGICLTLTDLEC